MFQREDGGGGLHVGRTRGCEFVCVCERGAGSCKHTAIREEIPCPMSLEPITEEILHFSVFQKHICVTVTVCVTVSVSLNVLCKAVCEKQSG